MKVEVSAFLLQPFEELSRLVLPLPIFRAPFRGNRRVEHVLKLGARLGLASIVDVQLGEEVVRDGAVSVVLQRSLEVLFGLLVAAAEKAGNLEVPAAERAIGRSLKGGVEGAGPFRVRP